MAFAVHLVLSLCLTLHVTHLPLLPSPCLYDDDAIGRRRFDMVLKSPHNMVVMFLLAGDERDHVPASAYRSWLIILIWLYLRFSEMAEVKQ